jgi:type I restriction enzyme S subunit
MEINPPTAIAGKDAPSRARKIVHQDDTIFATIRPALRRVAKVPPELDNEIVSTAFCILRPDTAQVDPDYLFLLASSDGFIASVAEHERGASYPAVRDRDVLDQEVNIPALEEQRKIAKALNALRKSALNEVKTLRLAEELKRAAMRELFTRGLRGEPQKETEIGPVPESWEVAVLSEVATIERGRFMHRPRNEPRFYGGKTPFIQTGDVVRSAGHISEYTQSLNEQGVAISRVFCAGTILMTIAANIGYSGVLEFDAACPDSLVAISPSERLINRYLNYYLQTQQPKMDREAPKGTQKNINIQFLSPWPVLVPTLDEQREIATILEAIDRKIALHRQKRAVLEELFKALLHKLMTGEIRVADLDLSALSLASVQGEEVEA